MVLGRASCRNECIFQTIYASSLMFACWDAGGEQLSVVFDAAAAFHRKACLSIIHICTIEHSQAWQTCLALRTDTCISSILTSLLAVYVRTMSSEHRARSAIRLRT